MPTNAAGRAGLATVEEKAEDLPIAEEVDDEPPTEPMADYLPPPRSAEVPLPKPPPQPPSPPPAPSAFSHTVFHFSTGVPSGETVNVRDENGASILSYRSFASVTGIVAALMAGIVIVAGLAAAAFLLVEQRPLPGGIVVLLCGAFAVMIAMVIPSTNVTIYEGNQPVITISQQSSLSIPVVTYFVGTSDGKPLARVRRGVFSRLGRNRWHILPISDDRPVGVAVEESFGRALLRKLAGKFNPRYQSDVMLRYLNTNAGIIHRRPNGDGETDILELGASPLDKRVAVAVATLVLGSEP